MRAAAGTVLAVIADRLRRRRAGPLRGDLSLGRHGEGSCARHVGGELAVLDQRRAADEDPVDVRRVHAPHDGTDRVVDGGDVGTIGSQHDDVGALARAQRAGDVGESGDPRTIDGGVADDVAGPEQVGTASLARQLEVERRGVLHGDDGPHLGEDVAGRELLVPDAQARPDAAIDELLHREVGPTPPAMSLAGVSATAVDDAAMASKSAIAQTGAVATT